MLNVMHLQMMVILVRSASTSLSSCCCYLLLTSTASAGQREAAQSPSTSPAESRPRKMPNIKEEAPMAASQKKAEGKWALNAPAGLEHKALGPWL